MSGTTPIQVPPPNQIRISKTGRGYIDLAELIKDELKRIEGPKSSDATPPQAPASDQGPSNNRGGRQILDTSRR